MSDPSAAELVDELLTRCTFPPAPTPVDVAVSGGADSLSLLCLAIAAGCRVTAHHVDHRLRPRSGDDRLVVSAAAERFGAAFTAHTVDVAPGPNLEARARAARFAALPDGVMTGHTLDDRVETMLLNLLRGAGRRGLAVVRPSLRHPIADLRRSETHTLCAQLGLEPVADPTNTDPRHLRNRVRHELVPLLGELADRDLAPVLARQGDLLGAEDDFLDALAATIDPTDAVAVATADPVLARRALRRWITESTGTEHPPSAGAVERALAVARGEAAAHDLEGGHRIHRTAQRLRIEPSSLR